MEKQTAPICGNGTSAFFIAAALLGLFLLPSRQLFSNDTWWHVALGDQIISDWAIPTELFSFTAQGKPIFCHWWLSDVIFSAIARPFGLNGLEALGYVLALGVLFSIAILARSLGASRKGAVAAQVLSFLVTQPFLIIRPQLFSALFVAWIFILYIRYRDYSARGIYLAPLVFLLWVNLHGGFLLGLVLLAGLLVFEIGQEVVMHCGQGRWRTLGIVLVLSVCASFCNPYGVAAFTNAFQHDPFVQGANQHIDEWLTPTLTQAPWLYAALALAFWLIASRRAGVQAIEAALFFAVTTAALLSWRHALLFGLFAVPILSVWLTRAANEFGFTEQPANCSNCGLVLLVPFAGLLFWQILYRSPVLSSAQLAKNFPIAAAQWVTQHAQEGNLFNTYEWGGFLVYIFRGRPPVYIDSRLAPYLEIFPDEYYKILNLESGWKETLQRRSIHWTIVPTSSRVRELLETKEGWTKEYGDAVATILRAPASGVKLN